MVKLHVAGKSNCPRHHHYNSTCLKCAKEYIEHAAKKSEKLLEAKDLEVERLANVCAAEQRRCGDAVGNLRNAENKLQVCRDEIEMLKQEFAQRTRSAENFFKLAQERGEKITELWAVIKGKDEEISWLKRHWLRPMKWSRAFKFIMVILAWLGYAMLIFWLPSMAAFMATLAMLTLIVGHAWWVSRG